MRIDDRMKNRQIVFTAPKVAELIDFDIPDKLKPNEVRVKTKYTAISSGTERANLVGEVNISGIRRHCNSSFPRKLGYCGVGTVEAAGSDVRSVKPGDRVIIYFGKHCEHNVIPEEKAVPIRPESLSDREAVLMVIGCFPENAIRKTRLELGESVSVVGLGILGLIAVQLARAAGAAPVIAVDLNPEARKRAIECGADFAVDPAGEDYERRMKELTSGKGVDVTIEATGNYAALNAALRCCASLGRVALLGCTRTPDVIDLYHDVHFPGVQLIGAHNFARPLHDSYPGCWTYQDDLAAQMRLQAGGRIDLSKLISEIHSPAECGEVFARLADDRNFPSGVLFDWERLE